MKRSLKYHAIFRPEPEGGFTVIIPSLPGCVSYGKNLIEARRMAQDAINGYLVSLRKHREPIPSDDQDFVGLIETDTSNRVYA